MHASQYVPNQVFQSHWLMLAYFPAAKLESLVIGDEVDVAAEVDLVPPQAIR